LRKKEVKMVSIIAISLLIIACLLIVVTAYLMFTLLSVRRCADALTELTLDIRKDWPQIREKAINIVNQSDEVLKRMRNILESSTIKNHIIGPIVTVFSVIAGIKAGVNTLTKNLLRR